jgi:cellulose synthase/poly-beta-1,6-N-acetylglucosamine synthase-like glycosyltransferase
VLIAAHNEARVLPRTLMALCEQTDPPDQILVVDDGSTDDTAQVMQTHFGLAAPAFGEVSAPSTVFPAIRWMRQMQSGKARALNAALEKITTVVVLTIDADTLPAPDALDEVRQAFAAQPDLVAAGGILIPICDRTWLGRTLQWFQTYEYIRNVLARFAWVRMKSLLLISGAFAAFRRDALMAVGGFDPECLVEDYELTHRLHRYSVDRQLGWQLRMVGTAHARTEAPSTLLAFLKQRRRWFAGFLQTQYWNRDMTGNRRYGRLGTLMLPIKALDTLQPVYGLAAFALLVMFLAKGKFDIAEFIFSVIGLKLVTDFAFQIWTIDIYRKLTGDRSHNSLWKAIVAALFEPFSFQLLRHLGATWGWMSFLTRTQRWSGQTRTALGVEPHVDPSACE